MYKIFQKIGVFKGKPRFANLFFNKKSPRTFIIPCGLKITVPNLIENVSFELFINGIYEENHITFINNHLDYKSNFIDVGANIGAISLVIAKLRPDVNVYAFEASPRVFKYLELNKKQNHLTNLHIYNLAIHSQNNISIPFYSPLDKNGKGSFSPVFTKEAEFVKTISLDIFFKNQNLTPDFIKVDVEGYEKLIFESMKNYLSTEDSCPVLFEFVDWAEQLANFQCGDAQQLLIDNKYTLKNLENNKFIQEPIKSGCTMVFASKN